MRYLFSAIAWAYDFIAEDAVLLVGAAVAIGLAALMIQVARGAAGYVLWLGVVASVGLSVWRTAVKTT